MTAKVHENKTNTKKKYNWKFFP